MWSRRSGASYRSIDSARSSGSQRGLPGPRRRFGCETRNETQFATRSPLEGSEFRDPECFTTTDAFIVSNWVLFLKRARWRSERGMSDVVYAAFLLRSVRPALAGGGTALVSAVGAERLSFFAATSRLRARLAVLMACFRTPRALCSASTAPS
jgi:hypothetical protein